MAIFVLFGNHSVVFHFLFLLYIEFLFLSNEIFPKLSTSLYHLHLSLVSINSGSVPRQTHNTMIIAQTFHCNLVM